jgi:MarR family transcriptional regulator, organic hydroperoxide resistance regulator
MSPASAKTATPAKTAAASALDADTRPAAQELGQAFKSCLSAVRRMRGRENHAHGELSDAQYGLLFNLVDHETLPTSELACLANLSPATATGMLDGLVTAGLVERTRSEADRRVVLTSLTAHGRALVNERHARFAPRFSAALEEFSDDELRTAAAVLGRLGAMFDEIRPSDEA